MSALTHAIRERLEQRAAGILPASEPVMSDEEAAALLTEYEQAMDTQQGRVAELRGECGRHLETIISLRNELYLVRAGTIR